MNAVLAAIDAQHCVVAGWSGGRPHALACAARLSTAAAVLVIAGVAPYDANGLDWLAGMGEDNIAEFSAALGGEDELRHFLVEAREHLKDVDAAGIVSSLGTLLPEVDRDVRVWTGGSMTTWHSSGRGVSNSKRSRSRS